MSLYLEEDKKTLKERALKKFYRIKYIIKSYFKMEPCGYCGNVNDEEVICYKCMPKGK